MTAIATMGAHPKQAVCYRCKYVGQGNESRCPQCDFPLIMEHGRLQTVKPSVRDIFDRTSVSINAPPLPGVDGRPRKAQIMAEARRKRLRWKQQARAVTQPRQAGRYARLKVTCAFVSALVAGLGAAVLMNGGL